MTERGEQPLQPGPVGERDNAQERPSEKQSGFLRKVFEKVRREVDKYPVEDVIIQGGEPKLH